MFTVQQTVGNVLCCTCGIPISPNAANTCATCLRSKVDITERLQKHVTIFQCPECNSYLQPPRKWIKTQLESKQLLSFCLKRLNSLNELRLIHAEFVWTEPHSKRIKLKLKLQKEVLNGVVLEQSYIVDYTIKDKICESCSRIHANPDQWTAVVQLRQPAVDHRKSFIYLEQLIIKHNAAFKSLRIKQINRGIDFFFANRSHAVKFVEFVDKFVPVRRRHDKRLVSHDTKNNNCNYKYTFSVEIFPICRDDLVCLPNGNLIGPLVICTKISKCIELFDPLSLKRCKLEPKEYRKIPFTSIVSCKQLVRYVVLNVDQIKVNESWSKSKCTTADVEVARVSDFGKNDRVFLIKSHLGRVLKPGDYAVGYDLIGANVNGIELDTCKAKGGVIPEVILVKKSYEERRRKKTCLKKVKTVNMKVDASKKMNNECAPSVSLEELVAGIKLSDGDEEMKE